MKTLVKLAVALTAVASCAAFAQGDSDADRVRRERNVDEVLAAHHLQRDTMNDSHAQTMANDRDSARERTHHIAGKTRETTHKVAQSTRNFTHRQAEKLRDFSARQNARYPAKSDGSTARTSERAPG